MTEVVLMLVAALVVAGGTILRARRDYLRSHPRAAARAGVRMLAARQRVLEAIATSRPTRRRRSHRSAYQGLVNQR